MAAKSHSPEAAFFPDSPEAPTSHKPPVQRPLPCHLRGSHQALSSGADLVPLVSEGCRCTTWPPDGAVKAALPPGAAWSPETDRSAPFSLCPAWSPQPPQSRRTSWAPSVASPLLPALWLRPPPNALATGEPSTQHAGQGSCIRTQGAWCHLHGVTQMTSCVGGRTDVPITIHEVTRLGVTHFLACL